MEARIALAGHPPFAIARPGEPTELIDARPGPPLGVPGERPSPTRVPLPPGTVLVGYSDGLVERRGESIDVGLERLRSAVTAGSPWSVCEQVMGAALQGHIPEDDVALIALRRRPVPDSEPAPRER
jgi:serine phosphatase RsbU (regulator of sigma subunit)